MRPARINYQKTFNLGNYSSERIGMEAELEGGDDAEECLLKLKEEIEKLHKKTNPGLYIEVDKQWKIDQEDPYQSPTYPKAIPSLDYKAKEKLEIDIDNAKTVDELIVYKDEVRKFGLIDYYADKLDKLKSLTV